MKVCEKRAAIQVAIDCLMWVALAMLTVIVAVVAAFAFQTICALFKQMFPVAASIAYYGAAICAVGFLLILLFLIIAEAIEVKYKEYKTRCEYQQRVLQEQFP